MSCKNLSVKLNKLRNLGKITVSIKSYERPAREGANLIQQVDDYVESLGFHKIGKGWTEISVPDAYNVLQYLVTHSIAYGMELMPINELSEELKEFMNLFLTDCRYFTNGNWYEIYKIANSSSVKLGPSWVPLSKASFDGGVICIDAKQVGMIWVEEDD